MVASAWVIVAAFGEDMPSWYVLYLSFFVALLIWAIPFVAAFYLGRGPANWLVYRRIPVRFGDGVLPLVAGVFLSWSVPFAELLAFASGVVFYWWVSTKRLIAKSPNASIGTLAHSNLNWNRDSALILSVSGLFFLMSLSRTCFDAWPIHHWATIGLECLLFGWMALAMGIIAWLANPLLFVAWIFTFRCQRKLAIGLAFTALAIGSTFFFVSDVPHASADTAQVGGNRIGIWLWLGSMVVVITGNGFAAWGHGLNSRAPAMATEQPQTPRSDSEET